MSLVLRARRSFRDIGRSDLRVIVPGVKIAIPPTRIDARPASVRYFDHPEHGFKALREREQNFLRRAMNRAPCGRARVIKDGVCPRRANSRDEASKRNAAIGGGYCEAHIVMPPEGADAPHATQLASRTLNSNGGSYRFAWNSM
jgi:hypothetical protein